MTTRASGVTAHVAVLLLLASGNGCAARTTPVEIAQIVDAMSLETGMHVADIGAGEGEWSEALALEVGPTGRVWSTEVDEDDLDALRERFEDAGLSQVTTLLGNQDATGLPDACCDAILLRLVYHHFTDPAAMRSDLRRALRPGGRLVVVEIRTQPGWERLEGVPERDGHGIEPETLLQEMRDGGWSVIERIDDWGTEADRYGIVFR